MLGDCRLALVQSVRWCCSLSRSSTGATRGTSEAGTKRNGKQGGGTDCRRNARVRWGFVPQAALAATDQTVAIIPVGDTPIGVAVTPDSAYAYVANGTGNSISIVEAASNTVIDTISFGASPMGPTSGAFTVDGAYYYVAGWQGWVAVIDTATHATTAYFKLSYQSANPGHVTMSPDGAYAYVNGRTGGVMYVIDTATQSEVATIPMLGGTAGAAFTPGGDFLYVALYFNNSIDIVDISTQSVVGTIPVGPYPEGMAMTPDGSLLYVVQRYASTVTVIDTATNTVVKTVSVGSDSLEIAITSDGKYVYVPDSQGNTLSVIEVASNSVVAVLEVGNGSMAVTLSPDLDTTYLTNMDDNTLQVISRIHAVTFEVNGGDGTAPDSQLVRFGDPVQLPATPSRPAPWTFLGWSASQDGSSGLFSFDALHASGPVTLYAQWSIDSRPDPDPTPHPDSDARETLANTGGPGASGFGLGAAVLLLVGAAMTAAACRPVKRG